MTLRPNAGAPSAGAHFDGRSLATSGRRPLRVAVYAFPHVHPSLLAFPLRVFRDAQALDPTAGVALEVFATSPGWISLDAIDPLQLQVRHGLEALTDADVVIFPSWPGPDAGVPEALAAAMCAAHARGARIVGLCLGVFPLARMGMLDGCAATVIREYVSDFRRQFPRVHLRANVLYVTDGRVTTSAGRAAAMDCCLSLVEELCGAGLANRIADRLVTSPVRYGDAAQVDHVHALTPNLDRRVLQLADWARSRLREPMQLEVMARRANMSTRSFTRHFRKLLGASPKAWLLHERLSYAKLLLQDDRLSVKAVADAAGFATVAAFRKQFTSMFGVSPSRYKGSAGMLR